MNRSAPIVVVGAGAAGLMAAIWAAGAAGESGRRVLLVERTPDGGRKILISGGGRCNVLPSSVEPSCFVTDSSPNTLKKLLLSWPLNEQRRFFERDAGLPLVCEQETGKLFPASNRSRDIRDALVSLAERRGVRIMRNMTVADVSPVAAGPSGAAGFASPAGDQGAAGAVRTRGAWQVRFEQGPPIDAVAVVLATGGLSVPTTGSDGAGLRFAKRLGHTVHDTYPALTPLVSSAAHHAELSGVSLSVELCAPAGRSTMVTRGGFLFTHRGYSGPAVLNMSHMAVRSRLAGGPSQPIYVRWSDWEEEAWDAALQAASGAVVGAVSATVLGALRQRIPERLARMLCREAEIAADQRLAELRREARRRLVALLARYPLPWSGDEGYRKAEVTGGGVSLQEIDPGTCESRRHPGLFFCGEMLDAFGPIGGYNFLWAWATGRAAGLGAARC